MMRLRMLGVMTLMLTLTLMIGIARAAVTHVVGGEAGWKLVQDNPNFYEQWSSDRTFGLNDTLVFEDDAQSCNVAMVGKSDYEECTEKEIIKSWNSTGQTVLVMTQPGDYYFIGPECGLGQRLHVKVIDGTTKPVTDSSEFHFHIVSKGDDDDEEDSPTDAAKDRAEQRAKEAAYNATADAINSSPTLLVGAETTLFSVLVATLCLLEAAPIRF